MIRMLITCVGLLLSTAAVFAQNFVAPDSKGLLAAVGTPPALDSQAHAADLEAVLIAQMQRSPTEAYAASVDGDMPAPAWALQALGADYTPEKYPLAFALWEDARADMTKVVDVIKLKGPQRKRPHQQDTRVQPSLSIEGHGSNAWPSGRAAATRVWAGVLSDLFPERAEALKLAAERSAALRVIGGVHYPSDLVAGKRLADEFLRQLRANAEYRKRLGEVRF
jgi:acid phosphatase (class A)